MHVGSYRDDYRQGGERSYEAWLYRAEHASKKFDRHASTWLPGFVHHVGIDKAQKLLADAGLSPLVDARHKIDKLRCIPGTERQGRKDNCQRYQKMGYHKRTHWDEEYSWLLQPRRIQ